MSMPAHAPAAPARKVHPIVVILLVLFAVFALGALAVVGGGLFLAHKVAEDPAVAAAAAAKLLAAFNPDAEIISTDDRAGTITIRDKKTNKTVVLSLDHIKNGHLNVQAGGKEVDIQPTGDLVDGGLEVKTSGGQTVKFGAAGERLPAWIPTYPGTPSSQVFGGSRTGAQDAGTASFELKQPAGTLADYYYDVLNKAGFKVTKSMTSDQVAVVQGSDDTTRRHVAFTIAGSGNGSSVQVTYRSQKD